MSILGVLGKMGPILGAERVRRCFSSLSICDHAKGLYLELRLASGGLFTDSYVPPLIYLSRKKGSSVA